MSIDADLSSGLIDEKWCKGIEEKSFKMKLTFMGLWMVPLIVRKGDA